MEWFRGRKGEHVLIELVGGDKGKGGLYYGAVVRGVIYEIVLAVVF